MRYWLRSASLNRFITLLFLAACLTTTNFIPRNTPAVGAAACPPEGCKAFLPTVSKMVDQIDNGDFEKGAVAWKEFSFLGFPIILHAPGDLQIPPRSGSWAAWLGGEDGETASIDQDIYVSSAHPYLQYWQWIVSDEVNCGNDVAEVLIDSVALVEENLCLGTNTGAWVQHSLDLTAYREQIVNLKFWVSTDAVLGTISSLYLDDVSLQGSP